MPKRIEILILWLVPALALESIAYFFADGYTPDFSLSFDESEYASLIYMLFRSTIAPLLIYSSNVVIAFWMWRTEKELGGRIVRWTLASLLLSYFVLIPYIGMYILWRLEQKDTAPAT